MKGAFIRVYVRVLGQNKFSKLIGSPAGYVGYKETEHSQIRCEKSTHRAFEKKLIKYIRFAANS